MRFGAPHMLNFIPAKHGMLADCEYVRMQTNHLAQRAAA